MTAIKLDLVWNDYRMGIKNFLHSKVSSPADVDDLLQEIMLKTHKSLDSLRSAQSIKAWLFQLAQRSLIDFYRKKGKSQSVEFQDLLREGESEHNDAESELANCVLPFIQNLADEYRDLLIAIDIEGQSQKDYAKEQGLAYSTLKSRVKKARAELRKSFESCCEFAFDAHGKIIDYTTKENSDKTC